MLKVVVANCSSGNSPFIVTLYVPALELLEVLMVNFLVAGLKLIKLEAGDTRSTAS